MGLEAPLALLGLLGVVIPLIAHRMRNRELPRVVLPTFALLARAAAVSRRRRAFSDVLLLLLRIAIVALIALGLSAPYLERQVHFGDGHAAAVAIIIDDSLSMSRRDDKLRLIDQAQRRALDVVGALPEGSEVSLVLAGKPARVLLPLVQDTSIARHALEAPLPAARAGDLPRALELAAGQLSRGQAGPRRILLLSDFAKHNPVLHPPEGVELSAERIGRVARQPNLYIAEAHAAPDPTQPSEISIAVTVRVLPSGPVSGPVQLEAVVAGNPVRSPELNFEHGVSRTVLHVPAAVNAEVAKLRIVADDGFGVDNEMTLLLGDSAGVAVLLVNGDPHPANRSDELFYVTRALALLPESQLSLQVRSVDPLSFEHSSLEAVDVVVLANAPPPSEGLAQRLKEFVKQGGGLIIAAGSRVDSIRYNALLGTVLPSHIRGVERSHELHFAPGSVADFLPDGLAGLREAVTSQHLLLEYSPADTLLSFDDGAPALTAKSYGLGRCLLLATSLDTDFGDLPIRPGFMPLMAAMIRDAAGLAAAARGHVSAGDAVTLPVPRGAGFIEIRGPRGALKRYEATTRTLRFTATDTLGVYAIRAQRGGSTTFRPAFVVDPPKDESDLSPGPMPKPDPTTARRSGAALVHKPLAGALWFALFALVVIEALLRARQSAWRAARL